MIDENYKAFLEERLPLLALKKLKWWQKSRDSKHDTLRYCLKNVPIDSNGIIAEFGVFKGTTLRMIANHYKNMMVFGFDSFEGFPDDGRQDWNQDFSLSGHLPKVPENVTLIKGFFEQTLLKFVEDNKGRYFSMIHIDCDIYSSTKTIFTLCKEMIKPNCLIVFDELLHYNPFLNNEMLALYEFIKDSDFDFEWVAIRKKVLTIDEYLNPTPSLEFTRGIMADYRKHGYELEVAIRIIAP